MNRILPHRDFTSILLNVEKPGRYVGGEYGAIQAAQEADLYVALSYPDLYDIGMSNTALSLLYGRINAIDGVVCERVFAPAPDFEEALVREKLPLYTLESGYSLHQMDIIAFTFGYELTFTNLLNILELGGVPCRKTQRGEKDPIVIAGGPALINPVPAGAFIDAVWIGEAEGSLELLLTEVKDARTKGAGKEDIISIIQKVECVWTPEKNERAVRNVWSGFGRDPERWEHLVVPNIRIVQDQAVVEIMRGCPNGCRFCNAGSLYKPFREKDTQAVLDEIHYTLDKTGYREVTLSSLSSGDYSCIDTLFREINRHWHTEQISFALPSLKVNTFTLGLLRELSAVRKSGLTFAVETPAEHWQREINKMVSKEHIISVLKEAREYGWRLAKFYFMIGLPVSEAEREAEEIIGYIREISATVKIDLNINIGTFVPKPHTPFEREKQLDAGTAFDTLMHIKRELRGKYRKVSFQSPFASFLEGMVSRGDERAGEVVYQAFRQGARLDAWEDYFKKEVWEKVIDEAGWPVEHETCRKRDDGEPLPWKSVDFGITEGFLRKERRQSIGGNVTEACNDECAHNCGICTNGDSVHRASSIHGEQPVIEPVQIDDMDYIYLYFSFSKRQRARFMSHLDVMRTFERGFKRAGLNVRFTEGFNPKPRLEFASPLPLGVEAEREIGRIDVYMDRETDLVRFEHEFVPRINVVMPGDIQVNAVSLRPVVRGRKRSSLMSMYWGSRYNVKPVGPEVSESIERFISSGIPATSSYQVRLSGDLCELTIKDVGSKDVSLKYFLKEVMKDAFSSGSVNVVRTHVFAKGEGEPVPYM